MVGRARRRRIGGRARFFALLALIGLLLVLPTPPEFRGAAWFVVILAGFWAVAFAIEDLTAPTYERPREDRSIGENLFAPPPPPGKPWPQGRGDA